MQALGLVRILKKYISLKFRSQNSQSLKKIVWALLLYLVTMIVIHRNVAVEYITDVLIFYHGLLEIPDVQLPFDPKYRPGGYY